MTRNETIIGMLADGKSYTQIGAALGVSRQRAAELAASVPGAREARKGVRKRECAHCGRRFRPVYHGHRYCSTFCRVGAWKRRRRHEAR